MTSSIDDNSKKVSNSMINSELKYKTVIMITHNIEELNDGIQIYEIENRKLNKIK